MRVPCIAKRALCAYPLALCALLASVRQHANHVAAELADREVSGMAAGIDSAAHDGALDAGGRTTAVFGTGIEEISPKVHRELAAKIARSGATVS